MKIIQLKEKKDDLVEYIKSEYDHLPKQTCINHSYQNDFLMSYLYKDALCQEDSWKYLLLATCSVMGLLERNRIKTIFRLPNVLCVDDKIIAKVFVEPIIDNEFKGILLTVRLNVHTSDDNICMKDVTKKKYNINVLATGLTAFLNIYNNLYHTHEFYKVLEYVNDITCGKNKKGNDLTYGEVSFIKLDNDGILHFIDDKGIIHQRHINEMEEKMKC